MGGAKANLVGLKFNRLLALQKSDLSTTRTVKWICKCDCGNICSISTTDLKSGKSKSCGCLRKEVSYYRNITHGLSGTKEFAAWSNIKDRCYNPNNKDYCNYGGRGIIVCDRWLNSFTNFMLDMGFAPNVKNSIERLNVNGNYEPKNCKWGTDKEQSRNKRTTVWVQFNSKKYIQEDFIKKLKITRSTFHFHFYKKKKSIEDIIAFYINKGKISINEFN